MTDKHQHADDYGGPESLDELRRRRGEASRKRMRVRGVKLFAERSPENQERIKRNCPGFMAEDD